MTAVTWQPTRPNDLEIATGTMLGWEDATEVPRQGPAESVRQALEAVVLPSLQNPPCVVSFSGGRDSSALLALAAAIARREGLPPPVPATLTFPDVPESDEREWQEIVILHIGLDDWERLTCGAEMDAIGPRARRVLAAHGVLFPANAYLQEPILHLAHGGSLLIGAGGDEVLDSPALPLLRAARGYERPTWRGLRRTASAVGPGRRKRLGQAPIAGETWLTPAARKEAADRGGQSQARLGLRWDRALHRWTRDRYYLACCDTLRLLGLDHQVGVTAPFLHPRVLSALSSAGGWSGFRSRSEALAIFVGDLLPAAVMERRSKATFSRGLRGPYTEQFLAEWTGLGVNPSLVDPEALRLVWAQAAPDFRSTLLLQQAALSSFASVRH